MCHPFFPSDCDPPDHISTVDLSLRSNGSKLITLHPRRVPPRTIISLAFHCISFISFVFPPLTKLLRFALKFNISCSIHPISYIIPRIDLYRQSTPPDHDRAVLKHFSTKPYYMLFLPFHCIIRHFSFKTTTSTLSFPPPSLSILPPVHWIS